MDDTINKIIRFDFCPLQPTKQGDDYYETSFRQLGVVSEDFVAAYRINYEMPEFSSKLKYYKRLINNSLTKYLNEEFSTECKPEQVLHRRLNLQRQINSYLIDIKNNVTKYNLDLDTLLLIREYSSDQHHNECTYIYHYLILALIRCYMEFQHHFIESIESDKQLSIDYFFVQTLKWKKPDNVGIEEIKHIEIEPEKPTKKPQSEQDANAPLAFTYIKLQSESNNINVLLGVLKKFGAIPKDFPITEFKHLFSGVDVANPIPWIGNKSDLSYLFKLLVNENEVLSVPKYTSIWGIVDHCFVDKTGKHFGQETLRKQQTPIKTKEDIEHFAYLMT